jgi:hypothetical protein
MHLSPNMFDTELDLLHPDAELEALLRSAPNLALLEADSGCPVADAVLMLRNEGRFKPLRLRQLSVIPGRKGDGVDWTEQSLLDLADSISAHPWLTGLVLEDVTFTVAAGMHAVLDAVVTSQLHTLCLVLLAASPAAAPALMRVLDSSALTTLCIDGNFGEDTATVLDEPAAALLSAALRSNCTLTNFELDQICFGDDAVAAATVLDSMVAHPSLRVLSFTMDMFNNTDESACAGAALSALVVANAPALHELVLTEYDHSDVLLAPLMEALPRNTHLRRLVCGGNRDMSKVFARERLLPAVRANSSLHEFETRSTLKAARKAEAIVRSRTER